MKNRPISRIGVLSAALTFSLSLALNVQGEALSAKVGSLKGGAFYDNGSGAVALASGAELTAGSVITTSPDSEIVLDLGASGALRVLGGSTLVIDRLNVESTGAGAVVDTQIDLRNGSIAGSVPKFASALSKYEIKVPSGVVSIDARDQASSFFITAPEDINVVQGSSVFVYNRDGVVRSVRIAGGNQFNASNNTAVPIPSTVQIPTLPTATPAPTMVQVQPTTTPFNFFISPTKGE
jgi:hypothetical protein